MPTLEEMRANPWGSLGQPKSFYTLNRMGDIGGMDTAAESLSPSYEQYFNANGQKYYRSGAPWQESAVGPYAKYFMGDPSTFEAYSPTHGYGTRADIVQQVEDHNSRYQAGRKSNYLPLLALAAGGLVAGPAIAGGLAGAAGGEGAALGATGAFDMAGSAGLEGAFGIAPGVDSGMFAGAGGVGGEAWGVNPQGSYDYPANFADNPTGAGVGGAGGGTSTTMGNATAGANGTGGWSNFLSGLSNPNNAIPLAGQVFSAITGANAATTAANAQLQGTQQAIDEQRRQYDLTRSDLAPWMRAGTTAVGSMAEKLYGPNAPYSQRFTMADFRNDPVTKASFRFGMDEGVDAINAKFAASGGLNSGAAAKAIARYATDYAGQKAGDSFNRFQTQNTNLFNREAALAGVGQTAANTVGNVGMNAANNIGAAQIGAGNARAASEIARSNAMTGAVNNFANYWQNQQLLNRMPQYTMG